MDDPIKKASVICWFIGGVDILLGLLVLAVVKDTDLGWLRYALLGEGVLFVGLGIGVSMELGLCALLAAILYTAGFFFAPTGNLIVIAIRVSFTLALWKAFFEINALSSRVAQAKERERERLEREAGFERQAAQFNVSPPGAPRPSGRSPSQGAVKLGGTPSSGRVPAAPAPPPGPKMVCPNCRGTFPLGTAQCPKCRVPTFED